MYPSTYIVFCVPDLSVRSARRIVNGSEVRIYQFEHSKFVKQSKAITRSINFPNF